MSNFGISFSYDIAENCKDCPFIDLQFNTSNLYSDGGHKILTAIDMYCTYRRICERAYNKGLEDSSKKLDV